MFKYAYPVGFWGNKNIFIPYVSIFSSKNIASHMCQFVFPAPKKTDEADAKICRWNY
ncbi:MAG TPA: hypothetical protein PLI57_06880 [Spirochaetota bacterium]|nr:hypothetical protein [Spirochaetota bacterium]